MKKAAVLFTRRECHLCHDAGAILDRLAPHYNLRVARVDIDDDPELVDRYQFDIPVIEIDGEIIASGRITEESLRQRIEALG